MMNKNIKKEISKLKFGSELDCPNCENKFQNSEVLYSKKYKGKTIDKKIICKNCGLIYKSPKMTPKSSDFFYDHLYIKYMFGNQKLNPYERHFNKGKGRISELELFREEIVNSKIPPLEIGCSSGGVLFALKDIDDRFSGIDIDKGAIEFAKNKKLNVSDTNLFELPNESRDFILMSHVVEHLNDLPKMIEKISNVLVEGGLLLIFVPDSYEMLEPPHLPHDYCFSRDTLMAVMSKQGLREYKFFPVSKRPKRFEKDLIVLFKKDSKTKEHNSTYNKNSFLKYKYYLKLFSIVNPILMKTKTKDIVRKILRR